MTPLKKYDFTVKTSIIRSEGPTKGLNAIIAPNPHQMNRIVGFLPDGTKIKISQRPGKGGMDFTKLVGGKVFAVAADGLSPTYEKDKEGKVTNVQKQEEGIPLYSSSGFYQLSSRDYPALYLTEAYTLLRSKGTQVWVLTETQLATKKKQTLNDEMDLDLLTCAIESALGNEHNLVSPFDAEINKKRKREIVRTMEDVEAEGGHYVGAPFVELAASKKDGNPFLLFCWQPAGGEVRGGAILRELEVADEKREGKTKFQYYNAAEATALFIASPTYKAMKESLDNGVAVSFGFVQGHVLRTSTSFRKKVENVLSTATNAQYGDGVYILAGLKGWTKGIVALMQSQHPKFPQSDYDAHHYVVACRQAELGMNKVPGGTWSAPEGIHYSMASELL